MLELALREAAARRGAPVLAGPSVLCDSLAALCAAQEACRQAPRGQRQHLRGGSLSRLHAWTGCKVRLGSSVQRAWSCMREMSGEMTMQGRWVTSAGIWKHIDLPAPVACACALRVSLMGRRNLQRSITTRTMTTRLSLPSSTLRMTSSWQERNALKPQYVLNALCKLSDPISGCCAAALSRLALLLKQ